ARVGRWWRPPRGDERGGGRTHSPTRARLSDRVAIDPVDETSTCAQAASRRRRARQRRDREHHQGIDQAAYHGPVKLSNRARRWEPSGNLWTLFILLLFQGVRGGGKDVGDCASAEGRERMAERVRVRPEVGAGRQTGRRRGRIMEVPPVGMRTTDRMARDQAWLCSRPGKT